jgi:hypothetical protein
MDGVKLGVGVFMERLPFEAVLYETPWEKGLVF